jgi:LmbE family N-acetylglucosaminyl deacetylase
VVVLCTNGDKGTSDRDMTPELLAATREREQQEASDVMGAANVVFLSYPDGGLEDTILFRSQVVRAIRMYKPDIIMAIDPYRSISHTHRDHRMSGQVAVDSAFTYARNERHFPEQITKEGSWKADKGVQIVRDVLSVQNVDAIYMHSDCVYSESTVQTLKELDQYAPRGEEGHIFIAAIDGCAGNLALIREGSTDQASGQPIPDFGSMVVEYIQKKLDGVTIEPGQVVQEGALWSPAELKMTDVGFQLFLSTTDIPIDN